MTLNLLQRQQSILIEYLGDKNEDRYLPYVCMNNSK